MSVSTLCPGCGGRVEVADDFARARARCPQCGVMCDLPSRPAKKPGPAKASAPAAPPTVALDAMAEDVLLKDDAPAEAPPRRPAKAKAEPRERRPAKGSVAPKLALPPPAPYAYDHSEDEDDSKPYFVPGLDEQRKCPGCSKMIPRDAVLCTGCGLDLRVGKKVVQEFEPVERVWRPGLPAGARVGLFVGVECVALPLMIWQAQVNEIGLFGWFFPWFVLTVMLAFMLGTYDRISLKRNKKGRVRLTKTWSVCFLPRPPLEIDVHAYAGLVYGQADETTAMEWITMFLLFGACVLPGLLFWYFAIFRATSQVALTKDHGNAAFILYRGGNQDMMLDIARTVRDVARLPAEG